MNPSVPYSANSSPAPATPAPKRPAARIGDRKGKQGFASLNPTEQRQLASKGGKAAHAGGQAHQWTKQEACDAGRKGGLLSRRGPARRPKITPDASTPAGVTSE